jgi:hypothetical protein
MITFIILHGRGSTASIRFAGGHTAVVQGATIDTVGVGIDASNSGQLGSLVTLDTSVTNSGPVLKFHDSSNDGGAKDIKVVSPRPKTWRARFRRGLAFLCSRCVARRSFWASVT